MDDRDRVNSSDAGAIDVAAWRESIRRNTFSNYHREMGYGCLREGSTDASLAHFREAVAIDGSLWDCRHWVIELLERLGRSAEAEAARVEARRVNPAYRGYAMIDIATRRLAAGEIEVEIDDSATAEEGMPVGPASAFRGTILLARGDAAGAEAAFAVVERLDEDDAARIETALSPIVSRALEGARFDLVEIGLKASERLSPGSTRGDFWQSLGKSHEREGRLKEAVAAFRESVRVSPDRAWGHISLGAAQQLRGRWDEASEAYDQAAAIDPANPWPHFQKGGLLLFRDRFEEAVAAFDAGLAVAPGNPWGHIYRAQALDALGRPDEADAERAGADPGWPWNTYFLAGVHLDRKRPAAAAALITDELLADSRISDLDRGLFLTLRGGILRALGEPDAALRSNEAAIAVRPAEPWPRIGVVFALIDAGRTAEAGEAARALVDLLPDLGWARLALGHALLALGRREEASRAFGDGLAKEPGVGWAGVYLGGVEVARDARATAVIVARGG